MDVNSPKSQHLAQMPLRMPPTLLAPIQPPTDNSVVVDFSTNGALAPVPTSRARGRAVIEGREAPLTKTLDSLERYVKTERGGRPITHLRVAIHGNAHGMVSVTANGQQYPVSMLMAELVRRGIVGPGSTVTFHSCALAGAPEGRAELQKAANLSGVRLIAWDQVQLNGAAPIGKAHTFRPRPRD
jgi:hypothetical protein